MTKINRYKPGFTIIELLVTLFVAAIFLIAGYQLYVTVIRVDGQTKAQVVAQNTAEDYLNRYRALVPSPCVASQPLNNQAVTVSGLANAAITVTVSCPKSNAISTLSKIDVVLKYGNQNPQQQVAYSAWSYSQDVCGQGWVLVPGNSSLGTPNFCVMKYDAKNLNGQAVSQAAGTPWVNISEDDAIKASTAACPTCHLITEPEWMTIAGNVMSVASNWSGGAVGSGYLYSGNNDGNPGNALAASTDDSNGYYGTNNSASDVSVTGGMVGKSQRRTLTLTNGEVIWDLAGNVWERTNATIPSGGQPGVSTDSGYVSREYTDSTIVWNGFPATSRPGAISSQAASWNSNQGLGQIFSYYGETVDHTFMRGGRYGWGAGSGVLALALNYPPGTGTASLGFRVAKSIDSQPEQLAQPATCPTGFIPVPGDARFGTVGFCVMKYEAKIQGNDNGNQTYSSSFVPESRASGTAWVNITQTQAIAESQTVCSGCHLMTDAEWMTLAANVLSVPSNWSGGAVGSGYIYRGHSDNSPSIALAASTDDSQGYYGETNTGGDQRRTLTLTNGQVIWDLAGDVWQWTNATIQAGQLPGSASGSGWQLFEWNDPTVLMNGLPFASQPGAISSQVGGWNSAQGIGMLSSYYGWNTSAQAYLRGGSYTNTGGYSGVLALALSYGPSGYADRFGFRVAK